MSASYLVSNSRLLARDPRIIEDYFALQQFSESGEHYKREDERPWRAGAYDEKLEGGRCARKK